jgi:hypothetical protein
VKVYAMNANHSNDNLIFQLYSQTNVTTAGAYTSFSLEQLRDIMRS